MKGLQADYLIPLRDVFKHPPLKRTVRALTAIKRFVKKHTRQENILIDMEVNQKIHENSKNIPRKIDTTLVRLDDKIIVYLKGSKKIEEDKKKREAAKKEKTKEDKEKKDAKKEEKEAKKEKAKETEKGKPKELSAEEKEKAEKEKQLEDKRKLEKAAESVAMKRS